MFDKPKYPVVIINGHVLDDEMQRLLYFAVTHELQFHRRRVRGLTRLRELVSGWTAPRAEEHTQEVTWESETERRLAERAAAGREDA